MSALLEALPRAHLDAVFGAAVGAVHRLGVPTTGPDTIESLRRSLGLYVRAELGTLLNLGDRPEQLPEPLRRHVPHPACISTSALESFARRRSSQWETSIVELLTRLDTDWADLVGFFGIAADAALAGVSLPLSDPHRDGRAVYKLTFTDGSSLIYKPRSVETERAFALLLAALRAGGCQPDLRSYKVMPREAYGWTEFVPTTFCESTQEITSYYQRQGAFLALYWLLCASDAIADNLVVSRDYPVWIDSECMSRPDLREIDSGRLAFPLWLRESMLMTSMVLHADGGRDRPGHMRTETGLNVSCTRDRERTFTTGDLLHPSFIRAVVQGFDDVYRWFLADDERRSLDRGPLAVCRGLRVRVILRSTQLYTVLFRLLAITSESTKDPVKADIYQVLRAGRPPQVEPFPDDIVCAELHALERGDVPYWSALTSAHDMREAHGALALGVASASCLACIARRLARMSVADLSGQAWLLASFLGGGHEVVAHDGADAQ